MRWLIALVLFVLIPSVAISAIKFPSLTGRVVDDAGMLSPETKNDLSNLLEAQEQKTTDQVVVVTVPSLQGNTIEDYGYQLGRAWGIGQKGKDNGIVLLVAPKEHKVRIEVGYGLEGKLTDAISSQIIQNIILPDFRAGKMQGGVTDGTQAILTVLNDGSLPQTTYEQPSNRHQGNFLDHFGFLIFIFFYFIIACVGAVIHGIIYLYYRMVGKPLPKRFATQGIHGSGFGAWYLGGLSSGGGFSGGDFSGGGFSGGGGGFGGGGASGGW